MEKKDRKKKFDINQWVPPNPLVHELKIKKELLSLGDNAKWFCITRWLDMQIQENMVVHIKNMKKLHSNAGQKWLPEDKLTYPHTMIAKIYFPITNDIEFKKIKMGFRNKEGKTYPRLGVSLPDKVYVDFTFPSIKGQKPFEPHNRDKLLRLLHDTNLLNYLPNRSWDSESGDLQTIALGGLAIAEEEFENVFALLTEKNWKILTEDVDTSNYTEFIKGEAPEWGSINRKGYYTPEFIASSTRTANVNSNEPDVIRDNAVDISDACEAFIEGDH